MPKIATTGKSFVQAYQKLSHQIPSKSGVEAETLYPIFTWPLSQFTQENAIGCSEDLQPTFL